MDPVDCPYCGEPGEIDLDPGEISAGEHISVVQDCAVCCRPWAVTARVGADGEITVHVERA
ncbi:MAG: CPXCG motif-containing cysteine-rich protein [Myxococcota bacterium]